MSTRTPDLVDATIRWFDANARPLPWRRPGTSPWAVLVSEFMLQQTQASRVVPRWEAFTERWPEPGALARASDADVLRAWDRLGYPRRALWLRRCAVAIVEHHGGRVPSSASALLALPGIGPYTAAAIASFAYGIPEPVVDTNVRRVLARAECGSGAAWAPGTARDLVAYRAVLPAPDPDDAAEVRRANRWNAAAMELGALVCTARTPACDRCPVAEMCAWRRAGFPEGAAAGPPRRPQARYAGSDREMRGRILRELRVASGPITLDTLHDAVVHDGPDERFERSLTSLETDALIVVEHGAAALPD